MAEGCASGGCLPTRRLEGLVPDHVLRAARLADHLGASHRANDAVAASSTTAILFPWGVPARPRGGRVRAVDHRPHARLRRWSRPGRASDGPAGPPPAPPPPADWQWDPLGEIDIPKLPRFIDLPRPPNCDEPGLGFLELVARGCVQIAPVPSSCEPPLIPPCDTWVSGEACFGPGRAEYYDVTRKRECCVAVGGFHMGTPRGCDLPTDGELEVAENHFEVDWEGAPNVSQADRAAWEEVIATAWWLLLENLDLVEWLACYYAEILDSASQGSWELYSACLIDAIVGIDERVQILRAETVGSNPFWAPGGDPLNGVSFIAPNDSTVPGEPYDVHIVPWRDAKNRGDDALALCVALDLAQTFLHELGHNCGEDHRDVADCACEFQFLLGRSWAAAVQQRYALCPGVGDCPGQSDAGFGNADVCS